MTLYKLLNASAKSWWHFVHLRKMGRADLARPLERKVILGDVELIHRMKDHPGSRVQLMVGRHVCCIPGVCVQTGYEPDLWRQVSQICGLTCIDTRQVDEDIRFRVCMNAPESLPEICKTWAKVGAVVLNAPKE